MNQPPFFELINKNVLADNANVSVKVTWNCTYVRRVAKIGKFYVTNAKDIKQLFIFFCGVIRVE